MAAAAAAGVTGPSVAVGRGKCKVSRETDRQADGDRGRATDPLGGRVSESPYGFYDSAIRSERS